MVVLWGVNHWAVTDTVTATKDLEKIVIGVEVEVGVQVTTVKTGTIVQLQVVAVLPLICPRRCPITTVVVVQELVPEANPETVTPP